MRKPNLNGKIQLLTNSGGWSWGWNGFEEEFLGGKQTEDLSCIQSRCLLLYVSFSSRNFFLISLCDCFVRDATNELPNCKILLEKILSDPFFVIKAKQPLLGLWLMKLVDLFLLIAKAQNSMTTTTDDATFHHLILFLKELFYIYKFLCFRPLSLIT